MAHLHMHRTPTSARRQRGLTLIEFMISVTIGLIMVAALATLIASQSGNRAEVDRAGRMIENGRYAVRAISEDLQLAGYWGELNGVPGSGAFGAVMPDPCLLTLAEMQKASQLHVQGYDNPAPAAVPSCVSHHLAGTDILVVRHADPDTSTLETAGVPDLAKLSAGQLYLQTGLNIASSNFVSTVGFGDASAITNAATFPLKKKDKATTASVRKFTVRIYYVAKCSLESGGSCDAGDGGSPIPTLKMIELGVAAGAAAWSTPVTLAEGIENLQLDYGLDTDGDGAPNGADAGSVATVDDWMNVMAVKVHLLARSLEKSPSHVDAKSYVLGTAGPVAVGDTGYKRHVFVQSVRLVNPSARRQS